jgi:GNAT superfamily N-acetyltransferase
MRVENRCFPPELRLDTNEKKEAVSREGAIVLLARMDGKVVGEAYGFSLDTMGEKDDPKDGQRLAFIELAHRYPGAGNRVFYNYSFAVLPEYQKRGIGTRLKSELIAVAKASGYVFFVDHARDGPSLHIDQHLGARVIKPYRNWYRSGKAHFLCEIKL